MERDITIAFQVKGRIKRLDSALRLLLKKSLHKLGIRYRVESKSAYGKLSITTIKCRLATFADGDFLHGNERKIRRLPRLDNFFPANLKFWRSKVMGNVERDHQANQRLRGEGWTTIRIWASKRLLNPDESDQSIHTALEKLKSKNVSMINCMGLSS